MDTIKPKLFFALIFIACIGWFISGCLGPKKINKWVAYHYDGHIPPPAKKKNDQIMVLSRAPVQNNILSSTEKETRDLLPLVLYWQFDYRNTCVLNPQIPINSFTTTAMSYSPKGMKQKLNDQKLELTIEEIPNSFLIDDKGHMVIFIVTWEYVAVVPEHRDLKVSYRLLNSKNEEVKRGEISVTNFDKAISLQMFQSMKKKTWEYLDQYDANITAMTKRFMDELVTEL